tara:strand:- start:381 stop:827 length:447 start_codon:yes stop_codon:yes gene_type:complete
MELKSLLVDSKTTWVEFPGSPDFEVELANLSRKELQNLRKNCIQNKFNRKTRMYEESLDDEKFVKEFTLKTVKGWKGLKLKYLEDLLLVDYPKKDADVELEYTEDNALTLVENSTEFDNWLNEVVFDLDNFRSKEPEKTEKEAPAVSG